MDGNKKIKIYENGQPNPKIIFKFVEEILEEGFASSDLELSTWLKDKLKEQGLFIKKIYAYGNRMQYIIEIASKKVKYYGNESNYIVTKLIENRQKKFKN